jgi:copper chaperone CopZ
MMSRLAVLPLFGLALGGATFTCPLCDWGLGSVRAETLRRPPADTAIVRLHVSGMTCGTCPATARVALNKLPGVYSASVTLADSLGVVRYDPSRLTPQQIAAHLVRSAGFVATIVSETREKPRETGSS